MYLNPSHSAADLRRIWPIKRTFLFIGVVALATMLAALELPLWVALVPVAAVPLSLLVRPLRHPLWLLALGTVAVCWLVCSVYRWCRVEPLVRLDGHTATLTGWVEEAAYYPSFHLLRVTESDTVPAGTRVLLYAADLYAPQPYEIVTSRVELSADVPRPADGILLTAFPVDYGEAGLHLSGTLERLPPAHWLRPVRQWLTETLHRSLPGEEGAVLAAICLGERGGLSEETVTAFRGSGLSHLLVVSGLHVSVLTLGVMGFLRRCRLGYRAVSALTMGAVLLFMLLIGLSPSVVRAGVMSCIWLAGRLFRRRSEGLNALGQAALVLLLANPYTAQDGSFQLSFAATFGVLALTPRLSDPLLRKRTAEDPPLRYVAKDVWNKAVTGLGACISATLATLPLLCRYFGGVSLAALPANLLVLAPGSGVLLFSFAGLLLCALPGGGLLGQPLLLLSGLMAKYMLWVADWCRAYLTVNRLWQLVLLCGGGVLLVAGILLLRRAGWLRLTAWLAAASLLAFVLHAALDRRLVSATVQTVGDGYAVLIQHPEGCLLLASHSGALEAAATLLEREGYPALTALFVGEGETVHTGHVAAITQKTACRQLLCMDGGTWLTGLSHQPRQLLPGTRVEEGTVTVTWLAADAWLVHTGGHTLAIGEAAMAEDAEVLVLSGPVPTRPAAEHTIYLYAELPAPEDLPAPEGSWICVGEPITLTAPVEGEWSMTVWR